MAITAVLITIAGIYYKQHPLHILPLYVSLVIGALQAKANRFASLLGGINSILYAIVYLYLGLYASALYAILFSCPVQLVTFVRWNQRKYGSSTVFRKMTAMQRIVVSAAFVASVAAVMLVLNLLKSDYSFIDSLSSLMGILISFLTMFAFIEYTWLMLPNGIIGIILNIATMKAHPQQITYLIFSIYSLICVIRGFFMVLRLYKEQQFEMIRNKATAEANITE
ncbi:MAG TPA: nicotinamide mononucleotide transporter [Clostridiales bacterium]|nr:nicotinamide mononucleotide transporter [Clostridiales bacterium]